MEAMEKIVDDLLNLPIKIRIVQFPMMTIVYLSSGYEGAIKGANLGIHIPNKYFPPKNGERVGAT